MPQYLLLDPRRVPVYIGLALGACRPMPVSLIPEPATPLPAEQVTAWADATVPQGHRLHRFKWLFQDDRASTGGQGSARIAPPDSLRFDVMGPFGSNPTAAVVVGDSARWVSPADAVEKMIPNYPLMWAMFGVAQHPERGAVVRGFRGQRATVWQYASGVDTVEYARLDRGDPTLVAIVRRAGEVIGRVETRLAPDGTPLKARLIVPSIPARLDITFLSTELSVGYPPDTWYPDDR